MPMMSSNTGWDDPTEVNWDNEQEEEEAEEKEEPIVPEPKEAIFKCTALYSYTVSEHKLYGTGVCMNFNFRSLLGIGAKSR